MNYEEKTYEEIFEAALEDSIANGLASHASDFESFIANREDISNYYVMDKSVISYMFRRAYESMTLVYNSVDLDLATGVDLENIGKKLGIPRPLDTQASVRVTFILEDTDLVNDINLEEGIIVSTEDGIEYETVEPLYISVEETKATVLCMSVEAGSHVRISKESIVNVVDELGYNFRVTNTKASHGGTDEYDDDEYRDLLSNYRKILIRGSEESFEEFLINFDGIDGYKLIPNWNGTGTVKVILDIDPDDSYLLNEAYARLKSEVTQIDDDIVMFAPVPKEIDIEASINVDIDQINPYSELEKEDIKSQIISAITTFINEGYRNDGTWYTGLGIGEDFIPHKLAVFLDEEIPELKDITFKTPNKPISIQDEEIGVINNIFIEMI